MFENFKEINLEALEESKFFMSCKKDIPRFVPPRLNNTAEVENYLKKQAETEENQLVETALRANEEIGSNYVNRSSLLSSGELMSMRANPDSKTCTLNQLNDKIQKLRDFLENIADLELVVSQSINDNAKMQVEKTGLIIRENSLGNATIQRKSWDKHVSEVNGDKAVLKIAKTVCQQILENYTAESAKRNDKKKISQITTKMIDLTRNAEKLLPKITQANTKAQKSLANSKRIDLKTCNVFIDATTEFSELNNQYSNLKNELDFYTKDAKNIPAFPALTNTETSAESEIRKEWRFA